MAQESSRMIYKTFDQSIRILFWTGDECLIFVPPFLIGIFIHSFILIGLAFVFKAIYSQAKKNIAINPLVTIFINFFLHIFVKKLVTLRDFLLLILKNCF